MRLDLALVERGLVESRSRAQALILAGEVRVNGETIRRADRSIQNVDEVQVATEQRWASRGALKLLPALEALGVDPAGKVCADIGASSGGFTDLLLRRRAVRVYAVDVAHGIIDWRLRQDPRVVLMERTNARDLRAGSFPEAVELVTVDVSFIGLEKVLPAVSQAAPAAVVVVLFKPQFQVGRGQVGKRGVVRDEGAAAAALERFESWNEDRGYRVLGRAPAGVKGPEGNQEWFLRLEPKP